MKRFNKLLSLLSAILLCLSAMGGFGTTAQALTLGDFEYEVDSNTATVTGYTGTATDLTIPAALGGCPVTGIGEEAFYSCDTLTSVVIPNSVTSIAEWAFGECDSLASVMIPESVTSIGDSAFLDTPWLDGLSEDFVIVGDGVLLKYNSADTEVTIPSTVKYISDAFSNCTSITGVVIGSSVTSIGSMAFYRCTSLASVVIPNSVTSIGDEAFAYCDSLTSAAIPDSVISIGWNTFFSCDALTSVAIPNSVISIGDGAFAYCNLLSSVVIGDGVASIGDRGFSSCPVLTSVVIGSNVESIGESAFFNCSLLTSVTIPASVTSIGRLAFGYCTALTDIAVEDGNASYMSVDGVLLTKDGTTLLQYPNGISTLTYITPNSVTDIGDSAFSFSKYLTNVTLSNNVESIEDWAFDSCAALASVTIPDSVTSIAKRSFNNCPAIIYCYLDSYAAEYAADSGIQARFFGDANGNGSVDAADAAHILRRLVELIAAEDIDITAANVTGTGTVTAADAARILRWLVELESTLAVY